MKQLTGQDNSFLEQVKAEDIPALATAAVKEANSYPVPILMNEKECGEIIRKLIA